VTKQEAISEGLVLHSTTGRLALVATVAGSALVSLDATVVNVALPAIGKEFGANLSDSQWVLTGYLLALASLILLAGSLADRYGRRKIFLMGTVWFAVASLVCGLASNVEILVVARILEGVGGALLTPGSLAILQASFREEDRAKAVSAWSGLGGVAGAIGPFVGGWLVDSPGWRWAFFLNVPVAAIVVVCALLAVPESRDRHLSGGLDLFGATLAVVGLGAATWALREAGRQGWTDINGLAVGVFGAATLGGFVWRTSRSPYPLVPPSLFRRREFVVTNVATVLLYAAIGVTFLLVAYQLQVGAGWSALRAGTALIVPTLLMLMFSTRSGQVAQRIGPRLQLSVGPVLTGAGLLLFSRIGPGSSWFSDVLPGSLVFGIGVVTFVAPLTAAVMGSVSSDYASVASGVNNAVARTASLAALAVIPVVSGLWKAVSKSALTNSFHTSMVIAAILAASAGPLSLIELRPYTRSQASARQMYCPVDGPPLQPDPRFCRAARERALAMPISTERASRRGDANWLKVLPFKAWVKARR
jgi:EmrB/QacA subfamily drug resistance transporter